MLTFDNRLNCQRAVRPGRWNVYALTDTLYLFRCPYCHTAYTMISGQALLMQTPDRAPISIEISRLKGIASRKAKIEDIIPAAARPTGCNDTGGESDADL